MARAESGGGRLPKEYREVKYIESKATATCDVNYGLTLAAKTASCGLVRMANSGEAAFAGVNKNGGNYDVFFAQNVLRHWGGTKLISPTSGTQIAIGEYAEIQFYVTGSSTYIFSYNGSSNFFIGKIYYFNVKDGDNLVIDLVPCYRKADHVAGFYDLINDEFYTTINSDPFYAGPAV